MRRRILALCTLSVLALCSCVATPRIAGRLDQNTYHSPFGNYSVSLPVSLSMGGRIQDSPWGVSFTDDFCKLFRIECLPMPPEEQARAKDKPRKDYLNNVLWDVYLRNTVLAAFPDSTVTYSEWIPGLNDGSLYSEVFMPKGAICETSVDGGAPFRDDAERGVVVFVRGGDVWVVSTGLMHIHRPEESNADRQKRLRKVLRDNTIDFMHTIQFTEVK